MFSGDQALIGELYPSVDRLLGWFYTKPDRSGQNNEVEQASRILVDPTSSVSERYTRAKR